MIDRLLQLHLEPVARDCHRWQLWRALARCWAIMAGVALAAWLLKEATGWSSPVFFFLLIIAGIAGFVMVIRRHLHTPPDYRDIARQIEAQDPGLHALLVTAVEQIPLETGGELNYLQRRVILEAVEYHRRSPWAQALARRNFSAWCAQWAALIVFLVVLTGLRPHFHFSIGSNLWVEAERSNGVAVTPGDTNIERGSPLVVLARFEGRLPAEAELVVNPLNENERRIPLAKNLSDPVYGGGVPSVKGDLKYHVEYLGGKTRDFKVSVFDYPKLDHADAHVKYPAYTGLSDKTIKDTRRVSAVEGSSLDYSFFLNKPVATATLVGKDQSSIRLSPDTNSATLYHANFTFDTNRHFELVLVDTDGRTNRVPPQFVLDMLKNRPPELKVMAPRGDQRVSALEEIAFQGEASADYGLRSYGIGYTLAGGDTKDVELGQKAAAHEKKQFNYLLPLESLGAQPDELLSYYLWAEDSGPDGQPRRVTSDIYFAEVRPFDEIFREGQNPDQQNQQQNNQNNNNNNAGQQNTPSERLIDLEKDIVTATWNLKRRELDSKPSDKFKPDASTVLDSQQQAIEQAGALAEQNTDPKLDPFIETATKSMQKAAKELGEAAEKNTVTPLGSAVTDEQSAYQALLKLSAREYQVARANRSQQRGQQQRGGQRAQRQLDQLDLRQTDNRYETQREANAQQNTAQQREQLQVANRLKELAQRQQDLNERLRELQASLQEARTEQQRQEIQDRLKRLRDEQQDVLADVDELRQRMDQPQNQSTMTDERQQLDQTRSDVQRASEALNQSAVPDALASGTRAQRQLQQLQDDVRKKNSGQFSEEMRQMRENVRQLAQKEQDINTNIAAMSGEKRLTETDEQKRQRTDLANQMIQQENSVSNLLTSMREVSEKSETAEPILSQQLYDTLRTTPTEELNNSIDSASDLVRRGFVTEAGQFEEHARTNIDELRRGVERAADSILGDGTEALRLAQRELQNLSQELNPDNNGTGTNSTPGQPGQQGQPGQRGQRGQRGGDQGQPGQDDTQMANNGDQQNAEQQDAQGGQQGNRSGQNQRGNRGGQQQQGQPGDDQATAQNDQNGGQPNGQGGRQGNRSGNNQPGQRGGQQQGQPGADQATAQSDQNGGQANGEGGRQGNRAGNNQPGQRGGGNRAGQPQDGGQLAGGADDGTNANDVMARLLARRAQEERAANGGGFGTNAGGLRGGGINTNGMDEDAIARLMQLQAERERDAQLVDGTNADGVRVGGRRGGGAITDRGGYGGADYWGPIVNDDYVNWTDRLRVAEEMVDVPDLSTQIAQIRDRARVLRLDYRRLGKKPDWAVIHTQIAVPLAEVRARVDEELQKRESKDALVPLDRDPVPTRYTDLVRRYYEQLGNGQ